MRRTLVAVLVVLLALPGTIPAQESPESILRSTPPGTRVTLVIDEGRSVTGVLRQVGVNAVDLERSGLSGSKGLALPGADAGAVRVSLDRLRGVTRRDMASVYRFTSPSASVEAVRNVASGYGAGSKVRLSTLSGRKLRGTIRALQPDALTLCTGRGCSDSAFESSLEQVRYDTITELGRPGMRLAAKIGIAVVAVAGFLIILGTYVATHAA